MLSLSDRYLRHLSIIHSFLYAFPMKDTTETAFLLSVTSSHLCGYLELKEEWCFYVFVKVLARTRPPGKADVFSCLNPVGALWSRQTGSRVCCTWRSESLLHSDILSGRPKRTRWVLTLSKKKKREREKTANFWQQHLIKSRGIIELKPVAFNCQDGEGSFRNDGYGKRENTGRGNHFQTTFKQCVRVKVFHFWASSTAPVSQICRPVKCTMKQCRSGFYEDKWVRMLFISWKEGSLVWSFFCSCMSSIWQRGEHFIFKKKSQWYPCGFVKLGSIPHKPKWPRACGDLLHSAA